MTIFLIFIQQQFVPLNLSIFHFHSDDAKLAERKPSPNRDFRPNPFDTPTQPISQSTASTQFQWAETTETTGVSKTWRDKMYPGKTNWWERNQNGRNVPVRTGNYRNTASGHWQHDILTILLCTLSAMTVLLFRS